ncbi:hypothetical protein F5144DRAFT_389482 [Chaetomium tenue]|uniref:Uncharacterized protein n=1 Tax=Chaetomium tenue TaxID=1854479 RepID=A0ACB7NXY3_9PEZI|nr:hypothetical protein F5144DRAFT_389482 [Chaetomium globosum]
MCATCRGGQRRLTLSRFGPALGGPRHSLKKVSLNTGRPAWFWRDGIRLDWARNSPASPQLPSFPAPNAQQPTYFMAARSIANSPTGLPCSEFAQWSVSLAGNYASFGSGAALRNSHSPTTNRTRRMMEGQPTGGVYSEFVTGLAGFERLCLAIHRRYPMTNRWDLARPAPEKHRTMRSATRPIRRGRWNFVGKETCHHHGENHCRAPSIQQPTSYFWAGQDRRAQPSVPDKIRLTVGMICMYTSSLLRGRQTLRKGRMSMISSSSPRHKEILPES